jgi:hypothetical protein
MYRSAVFCPMVICGLIVEMWVMLLAEQLCVPSVVVLAHRH